MDDTVGRARENGVTQFIITGMIYLISILQIKCINGTYDGQEIHRPGQIDR